MAYNIGINVIETEGKTSPALAGAPTSVAGFILRSRRGPTTDKPVRVSNFRQFASRFGGYHRDYPDLLGTYCVDGFFLNGGQEAYIARVVGDEAKAASVKLLDSNDAPTVTVTAGYRGQPDVGSWGNSLCIDIQSSPNFTTFLVAQANGHSAAQIKGDPRTSSSIDLSSFTGGLPRILQLKVEGSTVIPINFVKLSVPAKAPLQEVVETINKQGYDNQNNQRVVAFLKEDEQQQKYILLSSRTKGNSHIEILPSRYDETLERLGLDNPTAAPTAEPTQAQLQGNDISNSLNLGDDANLAKVLLKIDEDAVPIEIQLPTGDSSVQHVVETIGDNATGRVVVNAIPGTETGHSSIQLKSQTFGVTSKLVLSAPSGSLILETLGFADSVPKTAQGNAAKLTGSPINDPNNIDLRVESGAPSRTLTLKAVDDPSHPTSTDLLTITFEANSGDLTQIIATINAQANNRIVAISENNSIVIAIDPSGPWKGMSSIEIVPDDTSERLGFQKNSKDTQSAGTVEAYDRLQVRSIAGLQKGAWICLDDGITQDWHKIDLLEENRTNEGTIQYFVHLNPAGTQQYLADETKVYTDEFNLIVKIRDPKETKPLTLETWEKISLDSNHSNSYEKVNNQYTGSTYVVIHPIREGFQGDWNPKPMQSVYLGKLPRDITPDVTNASLVRHEGTDGDPPLTTHYQEALDRFRAVDIQLLAIPEAIKSEPDEIDVLRALTRKGLDFCAEKGDCMFVGHTPQGWNASQVKDDFSQGFRSSKVYGALYWPWITVSDPAGTGINPTKLIPPTGHVLGTYARIDQTRGIWKAPAGNEAVLRGALAVEQEITDVDHTDLVKNGSVNGIRNIRGAGIVIDASRTLSTDTRWLYVNVRLLFNYVKASLREGLRWVKQEPNRENLWNKIRYNTVTPFLQRLYQAGAFGPGKPEEVFTVVCGFENNPPDQIQLGNLTVEIYFYPARPAETIIIIVGQQEGGATASEPQ
jgi:hypothetical protein